VNTQDVLHAALPPAAVVLILWAFVAWATSRAATPEPKRALAMREVVLAVSTAATILFLLGGVFLGKLFAVEAAAAGGCVLATGALVARALDRAQWRWVFEETFALSGALFALLVGATTFSLVFRIFGTDVWMAQTVLASPFPPAVTAALVLLLVALCACALDAFEMIFVVVPIVAPLLIVQLGDAQQVAVLLLFVLQLGFLVPPLGYAVLMTRARAGLGRVGNATLLKALAPFLAAQLAVGVAVFAWPRITHLLDEDAAAPATQTPAPSDADIVRQMEEMARQPDDAASAPQQ
jgi:TRAP-type mannitol/chloroaromatic compound transport system permease large subunit